jgi:hypothetical protein
MARFKVGDTIKDTNPRCTHYGAIGKVVKIGSGKTTFLVTNKGDKYRKGDKLTKTDWQLEKQAIAVSTGIAIGSAALWGIGKAVKGVSKLFRKPGAKMHAAKAQQLQNMGRASRRMSIKGEPGNWTGKSRVKAAEHTPKVKTLPDGKKMTISTPLDSIMYNILSDTTAVKQRQAVLDSIRTGKSDPKEYNARIKSAPIKKEGEVTMFKFNGHIKVAETPKYESITSAKSSEEHMYPEAARLGKVQGVLPGAIAGGGLAALIASKLKAMKLRIPAAIAGAVVGSIAGASLGERIVGGPRLDKDASVDMAKKANVNKMREYVNDGYDVNEAARLAYPGADKSSVAEYVAEFQGKKKKKRKMYVDRVVLKSAELIQKAAKSVNFDKIAQGTSSTGRGTHTSQALGQVGALGAATVAASGFAGVGAALATAGAVGTFTGGTKKPNQVGPVSPTGGGTP